MRFAFLPAKHRSPITPHPHQDLRTLSFLFFLHSEGIEVYIVALIYIYLMSIDIEPC